MRRGASAPDAPEDAGASNSRLFSELAKHRIVRIFSRLNGSLGDLDTGERVAKDEQFRPARSPSNYACSGFVYHQCRVLASARVELRPVQ